jgi:hypothetical protein
VPPKIDAGDWTSGGSSGSTSSSRSAPQPSDTGGGLSGVIDEAQDAADDVIDEAQDVASDAADAADEALGGADEAVGGAVDAAEDAADELTGGGRDGPDREAKSTGKRTKSTSGSVESKRPGGLNAAERQDLSANFAEVSPAVSSAQQGDEARGGFAGRVEDRVISESGQRRQAENRVESRLTDPDNVNVSRLGSGAYSYTATDMTGETRRGVVRVADDPSEVRVDRGPGGTAAVEYTQQGLEEAGYNPTIEEAYGDRVERNLEERVGGDVDRSDYELSRNEDGSVAVEASGDLARRLRDARRDELRSEGGGNLNRLDQRTPDTGPAYQLRSGVRESVGRDRARREGINPSMLSDREARRLAGDVTRGEDFVIESTGGGYGARLTDDFRREEGRKAAERALEGRTGVGLDPETDIERTGEGGWRLSDAGRARVAGEGGERFGDFKVRAFGTTAEEQLSRASQWYSGAADELADSGAFRAASGTTLAAAGLEAAGRRGAADELRRATDRGARGLLMLGNVPATAKGVKEAAELPVGLVGAATEVDTRTVRDAGGERRARGTFLADDAAGESYEYVTGLGTAGGEAVAGYAGRVASDPVGEGAQAAGALAGSAAVMSGAASVSSRAGLASRAAIQPVEEAAGYGGYYATRAARGASTAQRYFPDKEPLLFSEEAAVRAGRAVYDRASRAGAAARETARGLRASGAETTSLGAPEARAGGDVPGTEAAGGQADMPEGSRLIASNAPTYGTQLLRRFGPQGGTGRLNRRGEAEFPRDSRNEPLTPAWARRFYEKGGAEAAPRAPSERLGSDQRPLGPEDYGELRTRTAEAAARSEAQEAGARQEEATRNMREASEAADEQLDDIAADVQRRREFDRTVEEQGVDLEAYREGGVPSAEAAPLQRAEVERQRDVLKEQYERERAARERQAELEQRRRGPGVGGAEARLERAQRPEARTEARSEQELRERAETRLEAGYESVAGIAVEPEVRAGTELGQEQDQRQDQRLRQRLEQRGEQRTEQEYRREQKTEQDQRLEQRQELEQRVEQEYEYEAEQRQELDWETRWETESRLERFGGRKRDRRPGEPPEPRAAPRGGSAEGRDDLAVGYLAETFAGFAGVQGAAAATGRTDLEAQGEPAFGEFLPEFTGGQAEAFGETLDIFGLGGSR